MAYNDTTNLSQQVAQTLVRGQSVGFLTDVLVLPATTKAGLKAAIMAVAVPNDQVNLKIAILRALDFDPNITDAAIASADTVAGLIALTGVTGATGSTILE